MFIDVRHQRNGREVPDGIVIHLRHVRERRQVGASQQERVPVRFRPCRRFERDHAAGARPVIDKHLPAPRFGELLACETRHDVVAAAWRRGHDQPDGLFRVCAPRREAREKSREHACHEGRDSHCANVRHGRVLRTLYGIEARMAQHFASGMRSHEVDERLIPFTLCRAGEHGRAIHDSLPKLRR